MSLVRTLAHTAATPIRIGLSAGELGLEIALGVVRDTRRALDGGESHPPASWSVPPPAPAPSPAKPEAVDPPPPVPPAAAEGDAIPAMPPPPGAKQVDDEPVLVAELAEAGASEGAGAEVRVEEPWDGYRGMTAAQVRRRIAGADRETVAAVLLFENAGRDRSSVVEAADRRLRRLSS